MKQQITQIIEQFENKLDSFDANERREALEALVELVQKGDVELPPPSREVNLHCHTFFSYNRNR